MKKLVFLLTLGLLLQGLAYPQAKINFSLANPHLEGAYWAIDLRCQILTATPWRVGSSNMRVDFVTFPSGSATVKPDSSASGANPNIHQNSNYGTMTTTSITGGTAISLNVVRLGNCYRFTTGGPYVIGRIRFNRVNPAGCIRLTIRTNSVVQDSITQWLNPADWTTTVDTTCIRLDSLTGMDPSASLPTKYELYQNYPNPFNPSTTIKYDIPKPGIVNITVFDILGKEIDKLVNGYQVPGRYEIRWDATGYSSGSYFIKIEAGDFTAIRKMVFMK